jgi:hypothetical protein
MRCFSSMLKEHKISVKNTYIVSKNIEVERLFVRFKSNSDMM